MTLIRQFQFLVILSTIVALSARRIDTDADVVLHVEAPQTTNETINVCDHTNTNNSFIYCSGRLLEAVNIHQIYKDSKTFVDMVMKYDPEDTLEEFNKRFGDLPSGIIDEDELKQFLDEYFLPPGSELKNCTPSDWVPYPSRIMQIADSTLRQWALDIHALWKTLCKTIDPEMKKHESRSSLVYVPHNFIMPGGRFREFYYWDTYWILKGLIASGMLNTTKELILNLAHIVEKHGFIPNGGRIYYLHRSQPPVLCGMVYEYYESTQDLEFVRKLLPILTAEFYWWHKYRTVKVTMKNKEKHMVYQYRTDSNVPRPESFREDISSAVEIKDKSRFWQDIASTAESGWDFSSRWLEDKKTLKTIETTRIIPVDLNALMCWNMHILEYLHELVGNKAESQKYRDMWSRFRRGVDSIFYNRTTGAWYDFNMGTMRHNVQFYPTMAAPLFTGCYHSLDQQKSERIFKLMNYSGAFDYPGGVPTSLANESAEQWDFPNGFPPLVHMVIEGLRKSENAEMQNQAYRLAHKWVMGNYRVFKETKTMWEKYNVIGSYPQPGAGGEYEVQDGFGWTNGVILDLLTKYKDQLKLGNLPEQIFQHHSPFRPSLDSNDDDNDDYGASEPRHTRSALIDSGANIVGISLCPLFIVLLFICSG